MPNGTNYLLSHDATTVNILHQAPSPPPSSSLPLPEEVLVLNEATRLRLLFMGSVRVAGVLRAGDGSKGERDAGVACRVT